jgi:hypothetical protein
MSVLFWFLTGAFIGFVAGALVYRNNMKKFEKAAQDAEAMLLKVKDELNDIKTKVKK